MGLYGSRINEKNYLQMRVDDARSRADYIYYALRDKGFAGWSDSEAQAVADDIFNMSPVTAEEAERILKKHGMDRFTRANHLSNMGFLPSYREFEAYQEGEFSGFDQFGRFKL